MFTAAAGYAAESTDGGSALGLVFPLILFAAFGFLLLSSRRRRRLVQEVQAALVPGQRVITTAGMYATVVDVDGGEVQLEISPGVVCRYTRGAVARVAPAEDGNGTTPP
jgi:preprotein translocase subunit YajC